MSDSSVYPLQNSREDVRATPSGPCTMVLCTKPPRNGPAQGVPTLQRCQPRRAVSMWASFPLSRCRTPLVSPPSSMLLLQSFPLVTSYPELLLFLLTIFDFYSMSFLVLFHLHLVHARRPAHGEIMTPACETSASRGPGTTLASICLNFPSVFIKISEHLSKEI